MRVLASVGKRAMAAVLCAGLAAAGIPGSYSFAASSPDDAAVRQGSRAGSETTLAAGASAAETVYAAAFQGASGMGETTLPDAVEVDGSPQAVNWSWRASQVSVPYETVQVKGTTQDGGSVTAQMEVIPAKKNKLVYFVDAGRDSGKASTAYDSVKELTPDTLKNQAADQTFSAQSGWGRIGDNFRLKGSIADETKKIMTGYYSSSKTIPLTYQFHLEAGDYTVSAGFYEWWNSRSMKLYLSGDGMDPVTSEAAVVSGAGSSDVVSAGFTVKKACTVTMEVQNATGGEAPVISWFAVAEGTVDFPADVITETEILVNGTDVEEAARNVNGLTYKGYGLLSGNSTSNLLMDYKTEAPEAYQEMLQVLFGGEHPLMTHVKMEMGNDGNNSTGADSCTMRFEDEEADVSSSPGFQLAADAKKINPDVKVSFLRWSMPDWVAQAWSADRTGAGYEAMYKWYRETVFDAYEKYGYVVDYIDPDTNETTNPDGEFIKWFRARVSNEKDFPSYMDEAAREDYHNIRIIASDENTSLNIVPLMRKDQGVYDAVDAIGFHYRAGDATSTADYRKMADEDDKEIWYSEGCATFSYTEYQENKTAEYGGGTIGGYQSPLALADNFIKSFVYSRKTHYIFQPAVGSFYEGAQYDHKEILSAREPWAGYVHYDPVIYMLEHFSKFAVSGWENEDNTKGIWRVIPQASGNDSTGSDHLKNESGKPSYMTLASPDKKDFSVVIVNNSGKSLSYVVTPENMELGETAAMEIWETKTDSYLKYQGEARMDNGSYLVTVKPFSMVTLTTLDCSSDEEYTSRLPQETDKSVLDTDASGAKADATDTILYADDFEYQGYAGDYLEKRGMEPRYLVDFSGAFLVKDGALVQVLNQSVGQWNNNQPNCVVGDFRWMNYKAGVDVTPDASGYAGINIRQQTGMGFEGSGYSLRITKDGSWTLKKRGAVLESGAVETSPDGAYRLELEGKGAFITAWVNGEEVASYTDTNPEYAGRVRLGCGWQETTFDNLTVETVPGYRPYATQLIDNASDEVAYAGSWDIISGAGGSNNDWYRSTSTSAEAGAAFEFDMNGAGFALIGSNDGSAVLDIQVDGALVASDVKTQKSAQHGMTLIQEGITEGRHHVKVTLKSGKLALDAIYFLPYSSTDKTALNELIAGAKEIEYDETYMEETWKALEEALKQAELVAQQEDASQTQIDQAYIALKQAVEGLLHKDSVVKSETWYGAAYVDTLPKLPDTLSCTTAEGSVQERKIEWKTEGFKLEEYATVKVGGTVVGDGFPVEAVLEVIPEKLVYFVSTGTGTGYFNKNTKDAESIPYQSIAGLAEGLKNKKSDQAYTEESGWGYAADDSKYKFSATVDGGDRPDDYISSNKYTVGLRDKSAGAQPMTYRFTLEAGTYELTAGYHEFYGSGRSRDMQPSVVWKDQAGLEQTEEGSLVKLRSADQKGSITFTLDHACVVEYRLAMVSGEAPMYSWIGVREVPPVDKTALKQAIAEAEKVEASGYTEESFAALAEALNAAKFVAENDVSGGDQITQKMVDKALAALKKAMEGLEEKPPVDKTALKETIKEAEALDASQYTEESFAALQEALKTARLLAENDVSGGDAITQDMVDKAESELQKALEGLVEITPGGTVDKSELRRTILTAQKLEASCYTQESFAAVQKALEIAVMVAENDVSGGDAITQEQVDAANQALTAALAGLVTIGGQSVDRTLLWQVIRQAQELDSSKYTEESYEAVREALDAALAVAEPDVSDGDSITQEMVNKAAQALKAALEALQEKQPDEPDTPDIPDEPDTPDTPDEPDTPDTPNTPSDLEEALDNAFDILDGVKNADREEKIEAVGKLQEQLSGVDHSNVTLKDRELLNRLSKLEDEVKKLLGVEVSAPEGFEIHNAALSLTAGDNGSLSVTRVETPASLPQGIRADKTMSYEIKLISGNNVTELKIPVLIRCRLSGELAGTKNAQVIHYLSNGETEILPAMVVDGYLEWITSSFSTFVIAALDEDQSGQPDDNNGNGEAEGDGGSQESGEDQGNQQNPDNNGRKSPMTYDFGAEGLIAAAAGGLLLAAAFGAAAGRNRRRRNEKD